MLSIESGRKVRDYRSQLVLQILYHYIGQEESLFAASLSAAKTH